MLMIFTSFFLFDNLNGQSEQNVSILLNIEKRKTANLEVVVRILGMSNARGIYF